LFCLLATSSMLLSCVTYNPLSAASARLAMIVKEFKGFNVIFLPGTQRCAESGGMQIFQVGTHTVYDFGYKKGASQHTNKSCGCVVALRTTCFTKYYKIYEPDDCIAGRVGAVRATRPDIDVCFLCGTFLLKCILLRIRRPLLLLSNSFARLLESFPEGV
jgi:hypothetical protein